MTTPPSPAHYDPLDRFINFFWRKPAADIGERTRRRVSLHLIPYLFFLYILAYLDRVNVSVAQLGMEKPPDDDGLGFVRSISGFGAGMFFWGYWMLEIPSTVSVVRWGARWVFVRILILWGICATLVGFIGTPFMSHLFAWVPHIPDTSFVNGLDSTLTFLFGWLARGFGRTEPLAVFAGSVATINGLSENAVDQFYFLRFMLGFFEGGFFPSVIVYLSHWFRAQDRAKAVASFMSAIPLSSMLGLPLSGLLLGVNWFGLTGWRWIFILEGVVPVAAGFATLFFLPNRPAQAKWLPPDEREFLEKELDTEHQGKLGHGQFAWVHHIGIVLLLTVVYFCLNVSSYGLSMFMPAIIKSQSGLSGTMASVLASLPYVTALIAMQLNGRHSDRTGERIWHVAVPIALMSVGLWIAAKCDGIAVLPVVVMIACVGTFMYAHLPAFWPIPTMFLGATAAASAIGFINMIGNLGGSVGPTMVGKLAEGQTSFAPALMRLAPWPLVAAAIILVVGYVRRRMPVKS